MSASTDYISLADARTSSAAAATAASSQAAKSQTLSSQDFMSVFLSELKNQNPLEPMSNQDMMNQMVQLNMLNQIASLNTTLTSFAKSNQVVNATALIGKQVQALSATDGTLYDSVVKSLTISGDKVQLQLTDGSDISLDWLTGVEGAASPASTGA
jgi:flagellar basal-body rod modification protein FlgD